MLSSNGPRMAVAASLTLSSRSIEGRSSLLMQRPARLISKSSELPVRCGGGGGDTVGGETIFAIDLYVAGKDLMPEQ